MNLRNGKFIERFRWHYLFCLPSLLATSPFEIALLCAIDVAVYLSERSERGVMLRLLIVDDEQVIADSLALILGQFGYETTAIYSGERAVEAASALTPDVVISDVAMGGMNGIEA